MVKILMALMGLNIGGAETHVTELSIALKRMGYDIIVASSGGIYVAELEKNGINHFVVPLNNKKPKSMIKSYFELNKIIKTQTPDIVHAHARIPGFICGLLQKSMKFKFITTDHGVFKTGTILNRITNWGDITIAVSRDIKDYLLSNYDLREENIVVTINGINTEKFNENIDGESIKNEFKLKDDSKKITYISRLDSDQITVPMALIEIAPALLRKHPNLQIIIVGGGDSFNVVKQKADEYDGLLQQNKIILTGPRTDINKFTAISDICIGVSRAALEGISAGNITIIAGREGYIGVFDETKFNIARENNFTCRGCEPVHASSLKRDILNILNMSDNEISSLKRYGKRIISDYYSIEIMAEDNIKAYKLLVDSF